MEHDSGTGRPGAAASDDALPLSGVRVVELSDKAETCGRTLADLGAEVVLVEPPDGCAARRQPPMLGANSLYFATHHANKRAVRIDLRQSQGRERLRALLADADIFIETTRPGTLESLGLGAAALREAFPSLVIVSITDFGQTGPYRDHQGTGAVHMAMSGMLSRSGLPGQPPLLPPAAIAEESAAMQAAWCALVAHWAALEDGHGDHLDFSLFDATTQVLDPPLGPTGSAANGQSAASMVGRDRPAPFPLYPIFPCADGHVRICVLAPRQWQGMFDWLGRPAAFADPSYASMATRMANIVELNGAIARLFRDRRADDLVAEGQRRGVPIAAVRTPGEVLNDPHLHAREAFVDVAVGASAGKCPDGCLTLDGRRAGIRRPAPAVPETDFAWTPRPDRAAPAGADAGGNNPVSGNHDYANPDGANPDGANPDGDNLAGTNPAGAASSGAASGGRGEREGAPAEPRRPLQGIKVLDLGVIVAGAELGRLLADQGADVVKVENRAFPDGLRQTLSGAPMSISFSLGHRGKRSVGIDLKSEEGRALFKRMVERADLVLSNFKPGTLESLGLGEQTLRAINPRLVTADSSAHGNTGPMSRTMGYGPLVRAAVGLTHLWRDPSDPAGFSDGITIYPDHVAARVLAIGALAALLRRRRTGRGGTASVAQAEVFLGAMATGLLHESLVPGSLAPIGNRSAFAAPHGVFPCLGDDEWCVVCVRDDAEWAGLCRAIGRPDLADDPELATMAARLQHHERACDALAQWTRGRTPAQAVQALQDAGVPAGAMLRLFEFSSEPHLQARGRFRRLEQPGLGLLFAENGPVRAERLPDPAMRPAPVMGEHTREVVAEWLGLSVREIDALLAARVLEEAAA
ncbi:MAG: CoA transferase [Burkholderiaceae bacterium]